MRAVEENYLTLRRGAATWTNTIHITPAGLAYLNPLGYTPTAADTITQDTHEH